MAEMKHNVSNALTSILGPNAEVLVAAGSPVVERAVVEQIKTVTA